MSGPDLGAPLALLCDADGNLFPSEEPAFEASTEVTNRLLADLGVGDRYSPTELRLAAAGRNFRATAEALAAEHGVVLDPRDLERRVQDERRAVTEHLARVLRPDAAVREPLERLARRCRLAVVTSSALPRVSTCLTATALDGLFAPELRFSAEDSLPVPASKPDPAIYALAGERLGVRGAQALAVEDTVTGTLSAVAAGFPTVGNLQFVPAGEREARAAGLREAGAVTVVASWSQLEELLAARGGVGAVRA